MTKEPEKLAQVFVALISIAAVAVAFAGGLFVYHQQLAEEKSGLWEPVILSSTDIITPDPFNLPLIHQTFWIYPFSSPPP